MSAKIILLIRHGQNDRSTPAPDKFGGGLTLLGRQQAELTALRLQAFLDPRRPATPANDGLPPAGPPLAIHFSTLRRARQTAEIIAGKFPATPLYASRLLHECSVPHFPAAYLSWREGLVGSEAGKKPPPAALQHWHNLIPAGVPWQKLVNETRRAARAYEYLFNPSRGQGRVTILVSHGNLIRYLICRALGADPAGWIHLDIRNAGISEVRLRPDGFCQVYAHNDTGHLPIELHTFI